jgi:molybdenum cofactor cytidylyltransferase
MIAAIILAAGASSRMGYPKALLTLRGATFLETILNACTAAGVERRVVVLGQDGDKILQKLRLDGVTLAWNRDPDTGPIASLRAGLEAVLNHPVDAVLMWHVDRPHVAVATIQALLDGFRTSRAAIVVPRYGERRGHPVLFSREVFEELLALRPPHTARAVVRAVPGRVLELDVADSAVIEDIDSPEDYRAIITRLDAQYE